jgi:hypothetical protein
VNTEPVDDFRLSEAERSERYRLLQEAGTPREPPVITEAGLRLLLDSATAAQRREALGEQLRPELDRLVQAGLIGADGRLAQGAKDVVEAVRRPTVQMEIEVAAGRSVRAWKAWLGHRRAVILAQPSPAIMAADSPQDVAGRQPAVLTDYSLQAVLPGWVPLAAARWLGLGPREQPGGHRRLPLAGLLRRLTDPGSPPPGNDPVLASIWDQPVQMCAITVQPGGEQVLLLDAARTGLWLCTPEDAEPGSAAREPASVPAQDTEHAATAVLTPLPSHVAWRLLLTLITNANKARRKGPI